MKVFTVFALKGGIGKTNLATNIAKELSEHGKTLIIDLDKQADTSRFFKANNKEFTLNECLSDPELTNKCIYKTEINNLDILPSSLKLAKKDTELILKGGLNFQRLKKVIYSNNLDDIYDYLVIDCPTVLSLLTINGLIVTDEVIIPVKSDVNSYEAYEITKEELDYVKSEYEMNFEKSAVMVMKNNNKYDKSIEDKLKEDIDLYVFNNSIRYQAKPITDSLKNNEFVKDTKTSVGQDYQLFLNELIENRL